MSEFLDKIKEIYPFLVGSDKSFKSMGGCSLKRPDKLYISSDIVLWIECDEDQHTSSSHDYACDEKRISDCYDEFDGKQLIVIRWNPDKYIPDEGTKLNFSKRLAALKEQILKVIKSPPDNKIFIYYMFYDEDNPLLSKNLPYLIIH
jgi:hypothetical protein